MNRGVIDYAHEVMRATAATGRRRLVLLALALHADDRGHARPSTATLGEWAGISRRNAWHALDSLVKGGELECVHRSLGGRPSEYRILLNRPGYEAVRDGNRTTGEAVEPPNRTTGEAVEGATASPTASLTASLTASHTGREHKGREAEGVLSPPNADGRARDARPEKAGSRATNRGHDDNGSSDRRRPQPAAAAYSEGHRPCRRCGDPVPVAAGAFCSDCSEHLLSEDERQRAATAQEQRR